jgi:hypothetical protein
VTVECLDTGEQFAVVAARDQNLCARSDGGLEDGKRSSGELVLFDLGDFVLAAQVSNLGRLEFVSGNRGEVESLRTSTRREASRSAPCMLLADRNINGGVAGSYCNLASTILKETWCCGQSWVCKCRCNAGYG